MSAKSRGISTGPRTGPCGTPLITDLQEENKPSAITEGLGKLCKQRLANLLLRLIKTGS